MAGAPADGASSQARSIRVVVRVRPLLEAEHEHTAAGLSADGGSVSLVNLAGAPGEGDVCGRPGDQQQQRTSTSRRFAFDRVFGTGSTQREVFEGSGAREMIHGCLDGFHATIFAYGQTGSGKTHTMDGIAYTHAREYGGAVRAEPAAGAAAAAGGSAPRFTAHGAGLTPRGIECLFAAIRERRRGGAGGAAPGRRFDVHCSYVQVYKEKVYDLLNPSAIAAGADGEGDGLGKGLRMRWSKREGFFLEDLYRVSCNEVGDALAALQTGASSKVMASHQLNMQSSRSHAIFTLYVTTHEQQQGAGGAAADGEQVVCSSKLSLVDLAGSERGSTIARNNARLFEESVSINKSLFTLRKVIQLLSKKDRAAGAAATPATTHVPYRDSKLTSLLQESLGGRATALMIACLSSSDRYYEENLSTLEYASLAARITNRVVVNEDPRTRLIRELRQEVAFLRSQLTTVAAIRDAAPGAPAGPGPPPATTTTPATPATPAAAAAAAAPPEVGIDYAALADARGRAADEGVDGDGDGDAVSGPPDTEGRLHDLGAGAGDGPAGAVEGGEGAGAGAGGERGATDGRGRSNLERLFEANQTLNGKLAAAEELQSRYIADNALLMNENAGLRDKLDFLEAVVCMPAAPDAAADVPPAGSGGDRARQLHTASDAVMEEVLNLRRENRGLHARLEKAQLGAERRRPAQPGGNPRRQQAPSGQRAALPKAGQARAGGGGDRKAAAAPKINSGRLSSTGYISTALAKVAEAGVAAPGDAAEPGRRGAAAPPDAGAGAGGDVNEARLSKLLQTRSAMAREHIVRQSSFNPVSR